MRLFLLFLIGGIIVINLLMIFLFPSEVAWLPEGFTSPIIAFEFLQTPEEVQKLFGSEGVDRTMYLQKMRVGHLADSFYLIFYSTFLGILGWIAAKRSGHQWLYLIVPLAILAGATDAAENLQLVALTYQLDAGDMLAELRYLHLFTWLKWGSLALGLAGLSIYLYQHGFLGKLYSAVSAITVVLAVLAFMNRSVITSFFTLGIVLLFFLLFVLVSSPKGPFILKRKP